MASGRWKKCELHNKWLPLMQQRRERSRQSALGSASHCRRTEVHVVSRVPGYGREASRGRMGLQKHKRFAIAVAPQRCWVSRRHERRRYRKSRKPSGHLGLRDSKTDLEGASPGVVVPVCVCVRIAADAVHQINYVVALQTERK